MTVSHGAQRIAALLGGDHEVERLGGRDDELGRLAHHGAALRAGGVADAHPDPERRRLIAELEGDRGDLVERPVRFSLMSTAKALSGETYTPGPCWP